MLGILCGIWGWVCEIAGSAAPILGASIGVEQANQIYVTLRRSKAKE
ncbi:MAG: hypothetical protein QXE01_03020 [Sulfolobales archaeon]